MNYVQQQECPHKNKHDNVMATNRSRANSPLSVRPISASVSKEEAKHAWFYQVEENYADEANVFFQKALDCRVRALKLCLSYDGSPTLEQQLSSRTYFDSLALPQGELRYYDYQKLSTPELSRTDANHHNQSGHRYCQPNDKNNAQSQQRQPMVKSRTHA